MILKIERYNNNQEWWMYDNIRRVSISKLFQKNETKQSDYDLILFDIDNCGCNSESACPNCKDYRAIRCRLNDDSDISIAFDTIAYLLNDNGKTIEKIVANYND